MVFPVAPAADCQAYLHNPLVVAIARTESSNNPFAIGVVGGHLVRQPKSKDEAVATALALRQQGINYSMGCMQVNQSNLKEFGLDHSSVFEPELNVRAGTAILEKCSSRAVARFGGGNAARDAALSCYYSGNFTGGQAVDFGGTSYVQRVTARIVPALTASEVPAAIPVVLDKPGIRKNAVLKESAVHADAPLPAQKHPGWDAFGEFSCSPGDDCQ